MTVYTFDGLPNGTDVGSVPGWTRASGNSGSMVANADGHLDIVSPTPNALYTCTEGASNDMEFSITWATTGGTNAYICCARVVDINNMYASRVDASNVLSLARVVGGTITLIGSFTLTGRALNDVQKISVIGNQIKVFYNGVERISVTDNSITTGNKMGFFVRSQTGTDLITTAEAVQISAYGITSVNDDEINAGAVNTAQVAGYVAGVNPVVSGTVGSLALTSVSQTGTTVSFTPPAPTNAAYWPEPGATHTLTLTDGTNPSTISAPFRPIPGHTSVVVASPDNADEYKLGYWATTPPVNGDRIMADFTVNPDTSFSGATDGLHIWYHWVSATSAMYIYEATIGGGVIIDNRGLSVAGVSVSGLSVSGLSVTGL